MMRLLKGLSKQTIREGVLVTCQETDLSSFLKGKQVHLQEDRFSYHALIAEELTMLRNIAGLRVNLLSSVCSVIIWVIVRNFAESRRNNCHNPIFDHFILIIIIILFIKKDKKIDDNDEKTSKMK
jgi:hypothetical protein